MTMKTEFEKMRSQKLYHIDDPEIQRSCIDTKELLLEFNQTTLTSPNFRSLLQRVAPGIPDSSVICPPFYCDHASSNHIGEHVFINYNCTFLGGAIITIGNHVLIGPNCQLLTPQRHLAGRRCHRLARRDHRQALYHWRRCRRRARHSRRQPCCGQPCCGEASSG